MQNETYDDSTFSSFKMMAMLLKKKWLIIIVVLLATTASLIISLNIPVWYKATVNVVPPKGGESGGLSGSIGSALKNFGLKQLGSSMGGGAGGQSYDFLVILTSRTVTDSIIYKYDLATVYDIPLSKMTLLRKTFLANTDITYEETGNYIISIWDESPQRSADIANDIIRIANDTSIRITREEAQLNTIHLESRYYAIDNRLKLVRDTLQAFSKEYMMFAPEQQAKSISEALSELKMQEMKYDMMYVTYKERLGENDPQTKEIKSILEQTHQKILKAETEPGFAGNFSVDESASIGLEYINYLADLEALTQMKSILLPMIEEAKYDEVKNIENLYVVDPAIPADKKDKPKRALIVGGTFLGSIVLVIFIILVSSSIQDFKKKLKEHQTLNKES